MTVFLGYKFELYGEWYGDYISCDIDELAKAAPLIADQAKMCYEAVIEQRRKENEHDGDQQAISAQKRGESDGLATQQQVFHRPQGGAQAHKSDELERVAT